LNDEKRERSSEPRSGEAKVNTDTAGAGVPAAHPVTVPQFKVMDARVHYYVVLYRNNERVKGQVTFLEKKNRKVFLVKSTGKFFFFFWWLKDF